MHLWDFATLELDNTGTNVNNRLGSSGATTITINGGNLVIKGSDAATTTSRARLPGQRTSPWPWLS